MKNILLKINYMFSCLAVAIMSVLFAGPVGAWEGPSDVEELLMDAINQGRSAALVGQNSAALLIDERLADAAADRLDELFITENGSIESLDASDPENLMLSREYAPSGYGEAIGMVMFQRYLSKSDAASALYNVMLQQTGDSSCLLDAAMTEVGVSVKTGVTYYNGKRFNYYIAVANVAVEEVSSGDKLMLLETNTIRQSMGLEAFYSNAVLYLKARYDLAVMLSEYVGDGPVQDFPLYMENVHTLSKIWITTDKKSDAVVRDKLMSKILAKDLTLAEDEHVVANPELGAAGVAIAVGVPFPYSETVTYYINAVVYAVAPNMVDTQELYEVSGILFDGQYDDSVSAVADAGLSDTCISAYGEKDTARFFTGDSGEFFVRLKPGVYTLEYLGRTQDVVVENTNKIVFLSVTESEDDL